MKPQQVSDSNTIPSTSSSKTTRKANTPLKVYCLPEERRLIEANANAAGLSLSAFLLAVGQGYQVRGVTDYERVRELARINGDLGRLGGLLKLWLTDDVRTAQFGEHTVRRLLGRIEATQDEMAQVMKSIVRPGTKSLGASAANLAAKNGKPTGRAGGYE